MSRLEDRCTALVATVQAIQSTYSTANPDQKSYLETIIGAAIWYLPFDEQCWTGNISAAALELCVSKPVGTPPLTFTKDHEYPRKLAAKTLLAIDWSGYLNAPTEMLDLYRTKFGRFNYVTSAENRRLMQYQREQTFSDVTTAYGKANIRLLQLSKDELERVRRGDQLTIATVFIENNKS